MATTLVPLTNISPGNAVIRFTAVTDVEPGAAPANGIDIYFYSTQQPFPWARLALGLGYNNQSAWWDGSLGSYGSMNVLNNLPAFLLTPSEFKITIDDEGNVIISRDDVDFVWYTQEGAETINRFEINGLGTHVELSDVSVEQIVASSSASASSAAAASSAASSTAASSAASSAAASSTAASSVAASGSHASSSHATSSTATSSGVVASSSKKPKSDSTAIIIGVVVAVVVLVALGGAGYFMWRKKKLGSSKTTTYQSIQ